MNNENLNATLRCVTRPSAAQEEKIKTFLKNKYQAENITLTISIDPSVRGGFILSANNDEYDWSTRSRQQQLQEQIQAARDQAIQMKKRWNTYVHFKRGYRTIRSHFPRK